MSQTQDPSVHQVAGFWNKHAFNHALNQTSNQLKQMSDDHSSCKVYVCVCIQHVHKSCNAVQTHGTITYNGHSYKEFIPQRTAAYINQTDTHLPELTVRETFDFAARSQGTGHKAGD